MAKVALLTTEFAGDPAPGGIGTYVHYLSRGLEAVGAETHIISVSNSSGKEFISPRRQLHRVVPSALLGSNSAARLPYSHYALERSLAVWKQFLLLCETEQFD